MQGDALQWVTRQSDRDPSPRPKLGDLPHPRTDSTVARLSSSRLEDVETEALGPHPQQKLLYLRDWETAVVEASEMGVPGPRPQ